MDSLQSRILDFLGQGLSSSVVASAVGCTQGYISQLLAEEEFREQVTARRTALLQQATSLDREYEVLESKLQEKLRKAIPFMMKPEVILNAIKIVNGAKRRGSVELGSGDTAGAQVIEVRMPATILSQFASVQNIQHNVLNQIIQVGEQSLVTAQPKDIKSLALTLGSTKESEQELENSNDGTAKERIPGTNSTEKSACTTEISVAALE